MITISLCMIVRNEEEVLAECLKSVSDLCDEIIIVDTGSTDETEKIAKEFTEHLFHYEWTDDFAAARNYAFEQATQDYILWLDADDILLPDDRQKMKDLKGALSFDVDAVAMLYHLAFDEENKPTFSSRRHRLVKRDRHFKWHGPVHEYLEVGGHIIESDIAIKHNKSRKQTHHEQSDRNIKIYEKRVEKGEEFSPRDLFYFANELKDHARFENAISYYAQFLQSKKGWVEDEIRACLSIAECYKHLNIEESELEALILTMKFDTPRPEAACKIGDIYKEKNDFNKAIFWYQLATTLKEPTHFNFKDESYTTWYPHIQLCYCYWQNGNENQSYFHHCKAKEYRPNDSRVNHNELFFKEYYIK
ncbi:MULTISPECIES: glycosyltransferase family 2 protein [Cytobacillus]|uniref:Glycosyl transferase n=1 Tax=Cytobacillus kochii TaxID=859143 RepID=A0A248TJZ6_9BACI|nr:MULTISPECIES: glycosyltransferase family 2 protein [Cytobacillus]ASV68548.1 glycosyl transferase [Cytobacillus kochii]MEA1855225.1 glycosyltransferase family 2 protein [Cytobacillus sp. OWB-43]